MTSIEAERLYGQVTVADGVAHRNMEGAEGTREFQLKELPEKFVKWQLDYKHQVYDAIERNDHVAFNAGHLPVVGTMNGACCAEGSKIGQKQSRRYGMS